MNFTYVLFLTENSNKKIIKIKNSKNVGLGTPEDLIIL